MTMQNLTFDQLPNAVCSLFEKLESIERLLIKEKPQLSDKDNLLTIKEAGSFLNLSIATIYSKVSRRELPCLKQNNRLYFIESELMDYLKSGRKETIIEIQRATLEGLKKEGGAK
jgi:predicted DNA-binding transcriptional regulator AlpA